MLSARNHRDFNHHFNEIANTTGVQYSGQWDLGVESAAQYLQDNYHVVGQTFAKQLLSNDKDLSLQQKASLLALLDATSQKEFDNAMIHCLHYQSIKTPVSLFLQKSYQSCSYDEPCSSMATKYTCPPSSPTSPGPPRPPGPPANVHVLSTQQTSAMAIDSVDTKAAPHSAFCADVDSVTASAPKRRRKK